MTGDVTEGHMGQWAGSDRSDIFSYLWHLACQHVCRVAYPRSNRPHWPLPVCGLSVRTWWLVWRLCSRALALDCLHNASGPGVQGVLTSRLLSAGVPLRVVACVPWRSVPASHKQMHNRKKGRELEASTCCPALASPLAVQAASTSWSVCTHS